MYHGASLAANIHRVPRRTRDLTSPSASASRKSRTPDNSDHHHGRLHIVFNLLVAVIITVVTTTFTRRTPPS